MGPSFKNPLGEVDLQIASIQDPPGAADEILWGAMARRPSAPFAPTCAIYVIRKSPEHRNPTPCPLVGFGGVLACLWGGLCAVGALLRTTKQQFKLNLRADLHSIARAAEINQASLFY